MALHSEGAIKPTPGTPMRLSANETDPTQRVSCHSFLCEALSSNVGKVYIGNASLNKSTLAGVYAIIAIPTTNILPTFSATVAFSANHFNLNEIYADCDNVGDGVLVSYARA